MPLRFRRSIPEKPALRMYAGSHHRQTGKLYERTKILCGLLEDEKAFFDEEQAFYVENRRKISDKDGTPVLSCSTLRLYASVAIRSVGADTPAFDFFTAVGCELVFAVIAAWLMFRKPSERIS